MPAYIFVSAVIHNFERFAAYGSANAALVARMGGKYLVLGPEGDALEGAPINGKKVISEWPNKDAALAYWHSAEYAEIRKLREHICDAQVMLLDGFGNPASPLDTTSRDATPIDATSLDATPIDTIQLNTNQQAD